MSSVTMSRSSFDSMDTDDSYSVVDSEEAAPQKRRRKSNVPLPSTCPYRYTGSITEKHNSCIYSAKFCPFVEDIYVFGTVAGRQVSVYECVSKKTIPRATYEDENVSFHISTFAFTYPFHLYLIPGNRRILFSQLVYRESQG